MLGSSSVISLADLTNESGTPSTTVMDISMDDDKNVDDTEIDPESCRCGDCSICLETIGYDPEIPCPHCPLHSEDPW